MIGVIDKNDISIDVYRQLTKSLNCPIPDCKNVASLSCLCYYGIFSSLEFTFRSHSLTL